MCVSVRETVSIAACYKFSRFLTFSCTPTPKGLSEEGRQEAKTKRSLEAKPSAPQKRAMEKASPHTYFSRASTLVWCNVDGLGIAWVIYYLGPQEAGSLKSKTVWRSHSWTLMPRYCVSHKKALWPTVENLDDDGTRLSTFHLNNIFSTGLICW